MLPDIVALPAFCAIPKSSVVRAPAATAIALVEVVDPTALLVMVPVPVSPFTLCIPIKGRIVPEVEVLVMEKFVIVFPLMIYALLPLVTEIPMMFCEVPDTVQGVPPQLEALPPIKFAETLFPAVTAITVTDELPLVTV